MGNDSYDQLFDQWGQRFNVDPQLGKTVFHLESGGGVNTGASLPNDPDSPVGPMQMRPSTAQAMAKITGTGADPRDPKQAIPVAMAYLAQGLNKTQSPAGALMYYHGGPNQSGWGPKTQAYAAKGAAQYPRLAMTNQPAPPTAATPPAATPPAATPSGGAPVATPTADTIPGEDILNAYMQPQAATPAPAGAAPIALHPGEDILNAYMTAPAAAAPADDSVATADGGAAPPVAAEPSFLTKVGAGLARAAHDLTDTPAELLARGADALGLTSGQGAQTATADQAGLQTYNQQYGNSAVAGTARVGGQIAGVVPMLASGGALAGGAGEILAAGAGRIAPMLGSAVGAGNALAGGTAGAGGSGLGNLALRGLSLSASGALQGGAAGVLTSGQSSEPVAQQALTGLKAGAALGPVVGAAGAAVKGGFNALTGLGGDASPEIAQLAQKARDIYKIPITGPQMSTNSLLRVANDASSKLPFSGAGAIGGEQQAAFNKAVAGTFGETADKITPEVMDRAATRIGGVFNDVAKRTTIQADPQLLGSLSQIGQSARNVLPNAEQAPVNRTIMNVLDAAQKGQGAISGEQYQALTNAGADLSQVMKSPDPRVATYASQVRDALDNAFQRSAAPGDQQALGQARGQYRSMKTIEDLAEKSTDGNISAPLLMGQVRAQSSRFDSSNGGMAYTGGGALGDLARIGQQFMKTQPDSGTPARLLVNSLMLGGQGSLGGLALAGTVNPAAAAAVPAGLVLNRLAGSYLRSGPYARNVINSSLGASNPLARTFNQGLPYVAPIGATRFNTDPTQVPNPLTR